MRHQGNFNQNPMARHGLSVAPGGYINRPVGLWHGALREGNDMKLQRRQFFQLAAATAALPVASRLSFAQSYPSRPVRVIVGYAPGGGTDIAARLIGQWLAERLGQPFVIENRPGAGGNIGTEAVVNAPADGHTLVLLAANHAISTTLYEKLNFNLMRDIAPVAGI